MRVVVLPADETGCGYYRMRLPSGAVRLARPDWTIEMYRPSQVRLGVNPDGSLAAIKGIADWDTVDLLVAQRVGTTAQVGLVSWARRNGIATIVDSDDAMWCVDRENVAWSSWNSKTAHWKNLETAAETADLMTVTTQVLANRYGKHGRCEVLPNCVPGDLSTLLESIRLNFDATPTIGWAGFTGTHPGDLRVVGDAVSRAVANTGCQVRVVGDGRGAARDWGLDDVSYTPSQPIGMPYYTALTGMDIGLVPLKDTPFNRGKSYLKALEFAATGLAVIASPTPANRELAKTVPIRLASTPEDWYGHIVDLVTNPEARADLAAHSQRAVFAHHTYEAAGERWAAAWGRAVARRQRLEEVG